MTFNEIVKEKHEKALRDAEKLALDKKCKKLMEDKALNKIDENRALFETIKDQINKNVGKKVLVCKNGIIKINSDFKHYFSKTQAEKLLDKLIEICNSLSLASLSNFLILADDISKQINEMLNENIEEYKENPTEK